MEINKFQDSGLTSKIIGSFFKVYNFLGYGFLEKVYENALVLELRKNGLEVIQQQQVNVYYELEKVGLYYCDIIVENRVIVELKSAENLCKEHEAQLINYLRATDLEVGLLFNFGKEPQFRRKIFSNEYKRNNLIRK